MNTASLENCKKLYELSGWSIPQLTWTWRHHLPHGKSQLLLMIDKVADDFRYRNQNPEIAKRFAEENKFYPAYDLGYLLRKVQSLKPTLGCINGRMWSISANYKRGTGDTPEDACALLAIKLIEEGILSK